MRCKISRSACMSLRPHSLSRKRHVKTYRNVTVSGSASDNSEGSDAMMNYFNVVYRPTNRDVPCWNLKELASGINFTIHINRQYETSPKTGLLMPSIVPFKSELSKSNHSIEQHICPSYVSHCRPAIVELMFVMKKLASL